MISRAEPFRPTCAEPGCSRTPTASGYCDACRRRRQRAAAQGLEPEPPRVAHQETYYRTHRATTRNPWNDPAWVTSLDLETRAPESRRIAALIAKVDALEAAGAFDAPPIVTLPGERKEQMAKHRACCTCGECAQCRKRARVKVYYSTRKQVRVT